MRHGLAGPIPVLVCMLTACQGPTPAHTPLIRDGMDSPAEWRLEGCVVEGGVMMLPRAGEAGPATAMRLLPPLPDTGTLVLTVRARATDPDSALHLDLWGFGLDDPAQQLTLQPVELGADFASTTILLPSGSSDHGIWLRVFTSSTSPIEVDDIDLIHEASDLWRATVGR